MKVSVVKHSTSDLLIIDKALQRAYRAFGQPTRSNRRLTRLRATITKFLELGERDFGKLAGIAIKIEMALQRNGKDQTRSLMRAQDHLDQTECLI